jgi:hypothetical protein
LKYQSGPKWRSIDFVVPGYEQDFKFDSNGRKIGVTRALRAHFRNHEFDFEQAAEDYRWTDDEKKALLAHLDKIEERTKSRVDGQWIRVMPEYVENPRSLMPCPAVIPQEDGSARACGEPVGENGQFCDAHAPAPKPKTKAGSK